MHPGQTIYQRSYIPSPLQSPKENSQNEELRLTGWKALSQGPSGAASCQAPGRLAILQEVRVGAQEVSVLGGFLSHTHLARP